MSCIIGVEEEGEEGGWKEGGWKEGGWKEGGWKEGGWKEGGWKEGEGEIGERRWGRDVKEGNGGKDREKRGMGGDEDGEEGMRVLYFCVWGGEGGCHHIYKHHAIIYKIFNMF